MKINEMIHQAEILEKAAETIQELQTKLDETQRELSLVKKAQIDPLIERLGSNGFTEEEVTKLAAALPAKTLQKVAKISGYNPDPSFEMGGPSSRAEVSSMDPMTAFLVS